MYIYLAYLVTETCTNLYAYILHIWLQKHENCTGRHLCGSHFTIDHCDLVFELVCITEAMTAKAVYTLGSSEKYKNIWK